MSVSLVEMLGLDLLSKVGNKIAELETENAKLREAARWRKWPEEEPEDVGTYQCIFKAVMYPTFLHIEMLPRDSGMVWNSKVDPSYWRPIGPLPKESE